MPMAKTKPAPKPRFTNPAAAIVALRVDIEGEITALREQIANRQSQLAAVVAGNATKAEYLARIHGWVDDQAAEFVRSIEYSLSPLRLPNPRPRDVQFGKLPVHGAGALSPEVVAAADGAGLMCWLAGDAIKTRLEAVIEASNYVEGPAIAAREGLRRDLQVELDALELTEERLLSQAEDVGLALARRPGARPEIILSLTLETGDAPT